jgi:hypothetical protein
MYRAVASLALLGLFGAWIEYTPGLAQSAGAQQAPKKNSKDKGDSATMTGCIDEENGHYVLISDQTRARIANLEAEGFPVEGFAKHVGHKVTVRGTVNPAGDVPLFRVRSIETINDTCEPQLNQ